MPVRANAQPIAVLAKIQVGILMAQNRQGCLKKTVTAQVRQRRGFGVLMGHRHQRYGQVDERADQRPPHAGRGDHHVRPELVRFSAYAPNSAGGTIDRRHLLLIQEARAAVDGPTSLCLRRPDWLGQPVGRGVETAEDSFRIKQRM